MDKINFSIDMKNIGIVDVEMINSNGEIKSVSKKSILYDDFITIISESTLRDSFIQIGKLPEGYYDGCLNMDDSGFECQVVVPKGIKPLIYYGTPFLIPFPSLFFHFTVKNLVLVKSYVYALDSDKVSDQSKLYHYPFGNVYNSGLICWGSNVMLGYRNIRDCEKIISTFFGSSTNDDLWNSEHINCSLNKSLMVQRGLLEYLNELKEFPRNLLRNNGMRVKDLDLNKK